MEAIAPIFSALAQSTLAQFPMLAGQLARMFSKALGAELAESDKDSSLSFHFVPALDRLRFRAMQTPDCFILHDQDASHSNADSTLSIALRSGASIPLLLCASEEKAKQLQDEIPKRRSVILAPEVLARILAGASVTCALGILREVILAQIHTLLIQPYDTTRPAVGNMFFGRELEMNLLLYSETLNLIISGPSKIGKTSMVMQFLWQLRRLRDPRLSSTWYISLQPCEGLKPDEIARYFARHFRDNRYTHTHLRFEELRSFVNTLRAHASSPLTLILDEVDAVCETNLLSLLAEFTRDGWMRLILLGRGTLRRHWLQHQHSGFSRFRELRPAGLSPERATSLVCDVLEEMGYTFENAEEFGREVLRITARQPFLLQYCARGLLELGIEAGTKCFTTELLYRTGDSFVDFGRLRSHLNDLESPLAQFTATCILQGGDHQHFSFDKVRSLLRDRNLVHDTEEVMAICEDLVINHLLGWEEHGFTPPRWDMCQIARKHPQILRSLREEYLVASRQQTRVSR